MKLGRIVLILSLAGMMLALHLWIQKERDFDQGCWGFSADHPVAAGIDCRAPGLQNGSILLGVSNVAWGYLFYFAMATLSFSKIIFPPRHARLCHLAQDFAVVVAFPYSAYLIYYQFRVAHAICPLCLVSAAIVTAIFLIQAWQYFGAGFEPIPESQRPIELGYASGLVFLTGGSVMALMLFVNRVATPNLDRGASARQITTVVGRALPQFIDAEQLRKMRPIPLDHSIAPLHAGDWIEPTTPFLGNPRSVPTVTLVTFLDPNCPHCVNTYATIVKLSERFGDRARFYVLPRILWDYSVPQVAALEIASHDGKYYEMWQRQFSAQKTGGLSLLELEKIFRDLRLNSAGLEARLEALRPQMLARRDQAKAAGINSTPTIYLNGVAVTPAGRSEEGLAGLITQTLAGHKPADATPVPESP